MDGGNQKMTERRTAELATTTSTTSIAKSIAEDAKGKLGRMHIDEEPYLGPPELQMDDNGEVDITTGQKMLSAVSGSLFTSLIGTAFLRS